MLEQKHVNTTTNYPRLTSIKLNAQSIKSRVVNNVIEVDTLHVTLDLEYFITNLIVNEILRDILHLISKQKKLKHIEHDHIFT